MRTTTKEKKSEKDHLPSFLASFGIRPTRQRVALASLLFDGVHKHVTAEQVLAMAQKKKIPVSLATVYNSLHQFTKSGLLREIPVAQACSFFDTNRSEHHHFFDEINGDLCDIPSGFVLTGALPKPPPGRKIEKVDVIVRLSRTHA